ncbi:MAG: metallophosphoesterase family protein [Ornithinimicrobium sp.]|uniref:metallophosphoesterase family protein n=1 Tax=Ornithinimicrobium sp. TaxID=1977084 RepID=UPI003D9B79D5
MVRFLHSADWQIGMTRRWLSGDAQARFGAARIEAIRRLGQVAREQQCEFVVVAGDVFESNQLAPQTVLRALEALKDVGVPVYLLPGNHDPLDAVSIYRQRVFTRSCPAQVHVLDGTDPVTVRSGVEIVAAPWHGKHPDADLVADAMTHLGAADGTVRIVVGHGIVDALDPRGGHPAAIATAPLERALAAGRMHYVALGDRHSRTSVGESGAIWYAGAPEVTDVREEQPGDVLVVDVEPGRLPVVTPHHVGTWDFRVLHRDLSGRADVQALDAELEAMSNKDRTVLQLALRGTLGLAEHAELTEALSRHEAVFAGLRDWERHTDLVVLADEQDWQSAGLGGFVAAAAAEIDEQARAGSASSGEAVEAEVLSDVAGWRFEVSRPDDRDSARDALSLLYRLTREDAR